MASALVTGADGLRRAVALQLLVAPSSIATGLKSARTRQLRFDGADARRRGNVRELTGTRTDKQGFPLEASPSRLDHGEWTLVTARST